MLRVELATHLQRVRSLVLLGVLVGLPVVAAATEAGGRDDATFSALNFAESGLNFMDPVLFGLLVAVIGANAGRRRPRLGHAALPVCTAGEPEEGDHRQVVGAGRGFLVVASFLVAAVLTGLVTFGWHPYHHAGIDLSATTAAWATIGAGAYLAVCLLSLGSIALALGLLLPRSVEALGISTVFLVGSAMIENVPPLHAVAVSLPVHYWMRWTQLFHGGGGGSGGLLLGLAVQAATIAVALTTALALLRRRDPAA